MIDRNPPAPAPAPAPVPARAPALTLAAGLDRAIAWDEGGSIRYLVAELSAAGPAAAEMPAMNFALAVDVSGSMGGDKIEAAREAATAIAGALTARDRLSIVAFDDTAALLLDARPMDRAGHEAARAAIARLAAGGSTNLFDGWVLAAERVATTMEAMPNGAHRVLLLTDGQANVGLTDPGEIAIHVGALMERGVVTSALGIGDGYDETLLGAIAEAGGGGLHDAAHAPEIGEVALGELRQGRAALAERLTLRVTVPATLRAEIVGSWAHTALPGGIEAMVGGLVAGQTKRVVVRLFCPAGVAGTPLLLGVSAGGMSAEGEPVEARAAEVELTLGRSAANNAQARDAARSLTVVEAWQSDALRRALRLNREGDRRGATRFLERELRWLEPYARGLAGADALVAELILVQRRIGEVLDPRLLKEVNAAAYKRTRSEEDFRAEAQPTIAERFRR